MKRWTEISNDPNSQAAMAARSAAIRAARRPVVNDKVDYVKAIARGKRVLDVGIVEHHVEAAQNDRWLHKHIVEVASYCLGVDVLQDAVEELRRRGFNVLFCDITKEPLNEQFNVIVAGDVIEHLGSPQSLFEAATRMLLPGGRLLLTTPNPFYVHRAYRMARGRYHESADHVAQFDASNISELAERSGMVLDSFRGIAVGQTSIRSTLGKLVGRLRSVARLFGLMDESLCNTMIYECVRA